jgi:hypothetical protein
MQVRSSRDLQAGATQEGMAPGVRSRVTSGRGHLWLDVAIAAAAYLTLCLTTLSVAPQSAEPDDGAYRASIVAITEGHFLTLSEEQARSLASELNDNPAAPPNQWVQVAPGRYLSEKDPGYPFLAAPFQKIGMIRWTPLFFGALACLGLFVGARRWLGPFGGATAVGLYCSSGAALAFAWRDYMPTFTDASLVAAGVGLLLWVLLTTDAGQRRRTSAGLAAFLALETATFVRYTNVVILICAIATVLVIWRLHAAAVPRGALWWWLTSVAAFGVGVAVFDARVYGGPLTTGYPPGEVTFALGAIGPNLHAMPAHLIQAMPALLLAAGSMVWIVARRVFLRDADPTSRGTVSLDLGVGLALGGPWLAIWALYSTYTWTTDPTSVTVQVVRFYLPALGPIAVLAAWLVTRLPSRPRLTSLISGGALVLLFAQGIHALHVMYAAFGVPIHG